VLKFYKSTEVEIKVGTFLTGNDINQSTCLHQ